MEMINYETTPKASLCFMFLGSFSKTDHQSKHKTQCEPRPFRTILRQMFLCDFQNLHAFFQLTVTNMIRKEQLCIKLQKELGGKGVSAAYSVIYCNLYVPTVKTTKK